MDIPTIVIAVVAVAAGGFLAWDKWSKREPKEPVAINASPVVSGSTRAEAFAHVDSLVDYFGEDGNQAGVESAKACGVALFASENPKSE